VDLESLGNAFEDAGEGIRTLLSSSTLADGAYKHPLVRPHFQATPGGAMTVFSRAAAYIVAASLTGLLSGCAGLPTGRFDALVGSVKSVETTTTETDREITLLTRHFMIFSPSPGPYRVESFVPVIEIQGQRRDFDFGPRLEPRGAALDVLVSYAEALAAFARKDYQGELDQATQSLGGSVQRLASIPTATAEVKQGAGVLATGVNALGRAIIDRMRKAALGKAMNEAAPGIQQIVTFVKDINSLAAVAVGVMRDDMLRKANGITPADGLARVQLNERVEAVVVESNTILARLKQINTAIDAIKPAHDEIREALARDEGAPLEKLKALVAEAKRLQRFYSTLK
jgi:hypothetical protein